MSELTREQVEHHCQRAEQTLGVPGILIAELWRTTDAAQRALIEQQAQRIGELLAELIAWRKGGVTEELLRKQDGYIKLGKGCTIVREEECATETLHDRYTMAALAGLLGDPDAVGTLKSTVELAREYADEAMRQREKKS